VRKKKPEESFHIWRFVRHKENKCSRACLRDQRINNSLNVVVISNMISVKKKKKRIWMSIAQGSHLSCATARTKLHWDSYLYAKLLMDEKKIFITGGKR